MTLSYQLLSLVLDTRDIRGRFLGRTRALAWVPVPTWTA